MRNNLRRPEIYDPVIMTGLRLASLSKIVGTNEAIAAAAPPVLYLDPNGAAQNVLLPLADSTTKGLTFFIRNIAAGAFAIAVKDSTNTTTFVSLAQSAFAMLHCDGSTWRVVA